MPKRKIPEVSSAFNVAESSSSTQATADGVPETPVRRRSTRTKKQKVSDDAWDYPVSFEESSPLTALSDVDSSPKNLSGKKIAKRRKKNDEPVVYDIPPVERKHTNFKGRLGYACLNTVLRAEKPESIFCSRTCRKDTITKNGLDFAKSLGLQNCRDLVKLIEWNEANNIRFMRISSEMFPFASHKELGYDLDYAKKDLKAAGDLAKRLGHRLTTHPGQFTQLASPKENVVEASVRELECTLPFEWYVATLFAYWTRPDHCQMMRYMGLGDDSVIIIHMGSKGVYGDKPSTLERFKENYKTKLTDEMKARLVLENDEPSVHPLHTLIPLINATWIRKGIKPKQHLSSPRPGYENGNIMEKRAHADRCYTLPDELDLPQIGEKGMGAGGVEVDLMIEAKDKEQAVFHLYRIYDLHPVKHENLRPEKLQKSPSAIEGEADEDDAQSGGIAGVDGTPSPTKRLRKAKSRKAKQEEGEAVQSTAAKEYSPESPLSSTKKQESASAPKSKGRRSPRKNATCLGSDSLRDGLPSSSPKSALQKSAGSLLNQEDAPEPVDGGRPEAVEAEQHPEAVGATNVEGNLCVGF
ncbi:hypothetical protein PHLCEN_2v10888 [Hermanssonia centrifuga]|uniref:Uncharacterized protein n=1 Tax=Hermanssonia centrifuga TaxID=98765 RepID=A0A2R6NLM6_9APHY|nr:hypothetical protein PHLCEN_2v10888 [Hermanssonia centrifuga]